MAKIKLLKSNQDNKPLDDFTKNDLKHCIKISRNESDLETVISDLKKISTDKNISSSDLRDIKLIRQKIYDKKRKIKESRSDNTTQTKPTVEINEKQELDKFNTPQIDFIQNKGILESITPFVLPLIFLICTCITAWFVWKQSIPLYEAIGFPDPKFCALGALLMIIGFATIHSLTKSKIVLLLCLYASTYEVILIANGTLTHDLIQAQQSLENNTELVWLKEKAQHSEQAYQEVKAKFDNPTSNIFQNAWYKQKYLTPAWELYSLDKQKMLSKLDELNAKSNHNKESMLKILFRLGLVFLCMVSVHNFLKLLNFKNIILHNHSNVKDRLSLKSYINSKVPQQT